METVVSITDVSKSYHSGHNNIEVLKNVSLDVEKGEFIVIMGASGSGKSTLLNLLGLLDMPDKGKIHLFNEYLTKELSLKERNDLRLRRIGIISQSFNLIPFLTAIENVQLPARIAEDLDKQMDQAKRLLQQVGLKGRFHHKPLKLSYGEQQRVAIARSLINRPDLVLADEPTGNLDSRTSIEIISLMKDLCVSQKQRL